MRANPRNPRHVVGFALGSRTWISHPRRAGFTLVELLIALTLLGVVLGAVVSLAVAQQRAHVALESRRAARAQLRDAAFVLARELRPLAVDDGDLRAVSDSALELVSTTGAAVVCAKVDARTIDVPPDDPEGGPALAWWGTPPRAGDVALVFDAGVDPASTDDRWITAAIDDVGSPSGTCAGSALARDAGRSNGLRVTLDGESPLPPTVGAGAPVRFGRVRRWVHYRGGDGAWYLGVRERDGAAWGETQPVAGPIRPRRAGAAPTGLSVAAFDAAGAPLGAGSVGPVAAFRLVLRATPAMPWRPGRAPAATESAVVHVAPRGAAGGAP